jgi:hypothetical protein
MNRLLSKLAGVTPADWRGLSIAYLYLLLAKWQLLACRPALSRWDYGWSQAGQSGRPGRDTGPDRRSLRPLG